MLKILAMTEENQKKSRILVAEDEKSVSKALMLRLTETGYDVGVAYNGEQALKALEKEKYDLLLLDLIMPKVDGFSVLESLKQKNIKIPVVILSNLSQESDIKRVKEYGVKDFFVKSYTPLAKILEIVKKYL